MIIDEPEQFARARRVGEVAHNIQKNHEKRKRLNLNVSDREISLGSEDRIFYSMRRLDEGSFSTRERIVAIEDMALACEREGYSLSLPSKILMGMGYIPGKITFNKN